MTAAPINLALAVVRAATVALGEKSDRSTPAQLHELGARTEKLRVALTTVGDPVFVSGPAVDRRAYQILVLAAEDFAFSGGRPRGEAARVLGAACARAGEAARAAVKRIAQAEGEHAAEPEGGIPGQIDLEEWLNHADHP